MNGVKTFFPALRNPNAAAAWIAQRLFTDAITGCKIFRRELFDRFALECRPISWAFAFEIAIKAQLMSLKIGEAPLVSIDRLFGG